MKLNLATEGVFPVCSSSIDGELQSETPATGYTIAGTLQGEGKLIGIPCLFVRTSSCNLRCAWIGVNGEGSLCDTPYTSHKPQKNRQEVEDIVSTIQANRSGVLNHVVISGGEPTMQTQALGELLTRLQRLNIHTTIETNATIFDPVIAESTNLISMSPKLSSSTPWEVNVKNTSVEFSQKWADRHERDRRNIEVIQKYIDSCYDRNTFPATKKANHDFQLKFVISTPSDIEEIEQEFLAHLDLWEPSDVVLMPEGVTAEDLMSRSDWVAEAAIARGWRFSPRLHSLLWGTKAGV